jgi:hypothetical protein
MKLFTIAARPALLAAALLAAVTGGAAFAQSLQPGDLPAKVTIGNRPLSAASDHLAAFTRGGTLYVNGQDLIEAVSGKSVQEADHYTITAFPGMLQERTAEFTIGSPKVIFQGKPVVMSAPAIRAYGLPYIPVSFFGQQPLRSKVTISPDHRSARITMPSDMH